MPPAGFELAIPASERLQIPALDRAATRIGYLNCIPLAINMQRPREFHGDFAEYNTLGLWMKSHKYYYYYYYYYCKWYWYAPHPPLILSDKILKTNLFFSVFYRLINGKIFHSNISKFFCTIVFEEETNKMLHLEHGFVWCWNLDASGSRSEIPGKFWNVVLEKDGEDQLDRSCEKWRSYNRWKQLSW